MIVLMAGASRDDGECSRALFILRRARWLEAGASASWIGGLLRAPPAPTSVFHIDIAEVQSAGASSVCLSELTGQQVAVAQLVETADRRTACKFLQNKLEAVP
jgi:hypothetical protein